MTRAARTLLAAFSPWLAFAVPAWGEDPSAEPAETPQETQESVDFDLGWDRGVTYEYRQRLRVFDQLGAPSWTDDVTLSGRIGGSLYLDGGYVDGSAIDDAGWEGAVRRARLYTGGNFDYGVNTAYKVEFALDDGEFFLNDFYLQWAPDHFVDTLRFGYFDPPATLQNLVASGSRVLMEVASPVAAFAPGFRLGLGVSREHERASATWYLNISSVGQEMSVGDASDEPFRAYGRLVWRPFGAPDPDASLLHLGASASWAPDTGATTIRYRSRPESYLTDYAVDTGEVDGSGGVLGFEAAWRDGPRILQCEALFARVEPEEGSDALLHGVYLQANWAITGEVRGYDTGASVFSRQVPNRPLHFGRDAGGGLGALELAARVAWLDLSDGSLRGGRMLSLSVGPAWTLNRSVRVLVNYEAAQVREHSRPERGTYHIFQARLELAF